MDKGNFFSVDNKIWVLLGRVWDVIYLTILWLITSIPVITIGASTTALYSVCLKMAEDREGYLTKQYFDAFKNNWKQATVIWIIMVISGGILGVNLWFYIKQTNEFAKLFLIVLFIFTILYFMILHYIFPVLAKFDNTIKNLFIMSFVISLKNFGWTILLLTITGCLIVIGVFVFAPLLICCVGLIAFLHSLILEKIFGMLIKNKENSENE